MSHFVVTYAHPDPAGWARHLGAHVQWLLEQVETGALRASGPTKGGDVRGAVLVFAGPDEEAVRDILDTDPYVQHGQVSQLTITEWDPMFGILAGESSRAGVTDRRLLDQLRKPAE